MNRLRIMALGVAVCLVLLATVAAFAKTCPNCGGDLTDKGKCPYCQTKPKVLGQ